MRLFEWFSNTVLYLESNYPQYYSCLCSGGTKSLSPIDFPIRLVNGVSFRFWIPSALLLLRNSRCWPPIALWDHFRIRCWHGRSVLCYPSFTYYWRCYSNKGKRILVTRLEILMLSHSERNVKNLVKNSWKFVYIPDEQRTLHFHEVFAWTQNNNQHFPGFFSNATFLWTFKRWIVILVLRKCFFFASSIKTQVL